MSNKSDILGTKHNGGTSNTKHSSSAELYSSAMKVHPPRLFALRGVGDVQFPGKHMNT